MRDASHRIDCDGRHFLDASDRVRLFHGVNVSGRAKQPPFLPLTDPNALDPLVKWGFNVVRLLLTWEGVEPHRGEYDDDYLDAVVSLASEAQRRGLWVLVDMHQDIFSRVFGGDGAPPWVVGGGIPPPPDPQWFLRYVTSKAVRRAQREFWSDRHGHRTRFLAVLERVMLRMRDVDSVIGYDPWNEPMSGLGRVASGWFERRTLPAFYEQCRRLRDEVDPGRLLFAEPSPLCALGTPTALRLPGTGADGFVYAPHIYDSTAILVGRYAPSLSTFPRTLKRHVDVADRLSAPLFIGEFGVVGSVRGGGRMLEDECRLFDRHFASWSVWHYNPSDRDWNHEDASIVEPDGTPHRWARPLFRPYPAAVAGRPESFESGADGPWELRYRSTAGGTTEVVVPRGWSSSPEIEVIGAEHEMAGDRLHVRASSRRPVSIRMMRR